MYHKYCKLIIMDCKMAKYVKAWYGNLTFEARCRLDYQPLFGHERAAET